MQRWLPAPLSSAQIQSRLDRLIDVSEADGVVIGSLLIRKPNQRYMRVRVAVPGYVGHDATFEFEESYQLASGKWRLAGYQYEVRWEPAPAGRWAEHWHDESFHRHCELPGHKPRAVHFEGQPIDLDMARHELRARYAEGADKLPCADLVPLNLKARRRLTLRDAPTDRPPRPGPRRRPKRRRIRRPR